MNKIHRTLRWSPAVLLAGAVALPVGSSRAEELTKLADKLIQLRGQVEGLNDDIEARQQDHRNRMASLSQRRAELEAQIQRQELDLEKVERQIAELRETADTVDQEAAALEPVALGSARELEGFVTSSLPFTVDQRLAEIDAIRGKLSRQEISTPRALNQLWTFVEDELRLARENLLFRQTIELDGNEQLADVVRVGMVMLFFRTGDGRYGYAARAGDGWTYTAVDGEDRDQVETLFDDFEKQVRTGFFTLPNALPGARR